MLFGPSCTGSSLASQVVCLVAWFLTIAIFFRAILSWFNMDPRSPLVQALYQITEPVLDPIRRIMPRMGMIDLSPMVAIVLLLVISSGLQGVLG